MAPKLLSDDRRHIVIRPLAYVAERDIARYARGRGFPLIPCRLCGSQENLQRVAVKNMLAAWEREFPGRTESIASALRHVEPEHLADPRRVDFAGLDLKRAAGHERARRAAARAAAGNAHAAACGTRHTLAATTQYPLAPWNPYPVRLRTQRCLLPNSYWVLPAQLLAGEHPVGATVEATRARLTRLIEAGVNCFIDLTQPGEIAGLRDRAAARGRLPAPPDPRPRSAGRARAHARDPRSPALRHERREDHLSSLPRRYRPHQPGGRLPARRARPERSRGAGRAEPAVEAERARGALVARCRRRRSRRST